MGRNLKILFDFDGTVTNVETIPFVASRLKSKYSDRIQKLTQDSCRDAVSYETNFRKRVGMMSELSIDDFVSNLSMDLLRPSLLAFIQDHKDICEIVSCNLDCWCLPFTSFLDIECHYSIAIVEDNRVVGIKSVLDKATVVKNYQNQGYSVIFVGDSVNDMEAMKVADDAVYLDNGVNALSLQGNNFFTAVSEDDVTDILDKLLIKYQL